MTICEVIYLQYVLNPPCVLHLQDAGVFFKKLTD